MLHICSISLINKSEIIAHFHYTQGITRRSVWLVRGGAVIGLAPEQLNYEEKSQWRRTVGVAVFDLTGRRILHLQQRLCVV